jgi:hypothetical protein
VTAYSVYSQLPSKTGGHLLHPQHEDAPCRGDKGPTQHGELAIKELKNDKTSGPDGLPAHVFKYGGDILNKYLYKLICEIWTKEEMPVNWKVRLICPVYKKRRSSGV